MYILPSGFKLSLLKSFTNTKLCNATLYMIHIRFPLIIHSLQYDYGGWMPNTPIALQRPPPTTKGTTSEATMLQTFPDINTTVQGMATMWLLSKQSSDFVSAHIM